MATTSSNKNIYFIIAGIILLAVIGFVGYKLWHRHIIATRVQQNTPAAMGQPTITSATQTATSSTGKNSNTSNQQIDQDIQSVQNSMNQLQQDQGTSSQDTAKQSQDIPQQ